MVKITKTSGEVYEYPDQAMAGFMINSFLKDEFDKICKKYKINKSSLIEAIIQEIVLREKGNSISTEFSFISFELLNKNYLKTRKAYNSRITY